MQWKLLDPRASMEMLGFIPDMLSEANPKSAREQLNDGYQHGGGWYPTKVKFHLNEDFSLSYPEDPPMRAIAMTTLHGEETIVVCECSWVVVIQKDGSFEVCRMD